MTVRVILADDHDDVRASLRILLEREDDIRVVAEARDGAELVAKAAACRPDVLLVDIRMPKMDGLSALHFLKESAGEGESPHAIVLTTYDLDEYIFEALRAGASGFLIKNASPDQLRQAVRTVHQGNALLDPTVTRRVIERFAGTRRSLEAPRFDLSTLTEREREIVQLVAKGLSNREIADALYISYWTVKTHVRSILDKIDARDRTQIVIAAYEDDARSGGTGTGARS